MDKFPPRDLPSIYFDRVSHINSSPDVVKYYLFKENFSFDVESLEEDVVPVAQIISGKMEFVFVTMYFINALSGMLKNGDFTEEQTDLLMTMYNEVKLDESRAN